VTQRLLLQVVQASFLLSVFLRANLGPPDYDICLPVELDLDC
jgi:hypothetical protein